MERTSDKSVSGNIDEAPNSNKSPPQGEKSKHFSFEKQAASYQTVAPSPVKKPRKRKSDKIPHPSQVKRPKIPVKDNTSSNTAVGKNIAHTDCPLEGFISLFIPQPAMPLGASYLKKQFVVNELLCFLQNRIDVVTFTALTKITTDFYPHNAIREAKKILFQMVPSRGLRYRECIGPNKATEDVKDILKLMLSAELADIPIFLAADTTMLPPMGSDNQDMVSILRNIESMQESISMLTSSQKDLSDIVHSQVSKPLRLRDNTVNTEPTLVSKPLRLRDDAVNTESPQISTQPSNISKCTAAKISYSEVVQSTHSAKGSDMEESLSEVSASSEEEQPETLELSSARHFPPIAPREWVNSNYQSQKPSNKQYKLAPPRKPAGNPPQGQNPREAIMVGCGTAPGLKVARRSRASRTPSPSS